MVDKPVAPTPPEPALRSQPSTYAANLDENIKFWPALLAYLIAVVNYVEEKVAQALAAYLAGSVNPGDLAGQAGKLIRVNEDEDAVEFFDDPTDRVADIEQTLSTVGHRNKIVNGDFDVWQNGTSFTGTGFTADQWYLTKAEGSVVSVTRQTHTLGQTDVPGNPKFFARWSRSVAGVAAGTFQNVMMEGVSTLAGLKVTETFWIKASAATELAVSFVQNFGTGGSPSTAVVTAVPGTLSLTTGWQKVSVAVDLPSIAGKTLGTNGNDYLSLVLTRPHNSPNPTADVDLSRVSMVEGDATGEADPTTPRPPEIERALCLPYFERVPFSGFSGVAFTTSGVRVSGKWTPKRAIPTLSLSTSSPQFAIGTTTSNVGSGSVVDFSNHSTVGGRVNITGFSGLTAGQPAFGENGDHGLLVDARIIPS
ncbi:hypothetical protein [uncultured Maritimibacter sp.]|jgi:hypothetical protein|uniref:hypothetical protein n=1 Tax=uncultured Maritimibacter sp. TaxID=991866 RepID=UPI00262CC771|nr:hypothetical protein [uncultured Maritimibacter sp.]